MVKAELLKLVKEHKPTVLYRATQIATEEHPHTLFTPPYHPELQPIEIIWAQVKRAIFADPASDMDELGQRIDEFFSSVTSSNWTNAYRHTQKYEETYIEAADSCELAEDDAEDNGADSDVLEDDDEIQEVIAESGNVTHYAF